MHRSKRLFAAVILTLSVVSACGTGGTKSASDIAPTLSPRLSAAAAAQGTTAGRQAATAGRTAAGRKTVAFLEYTSQAAALRRVATGMKAAAKELGWRFVSCDAGGNAQKVTSCASSFLLSHVDVITSVAIPQALMAGEMRQARAQHIPWISSGGQIPPNENLYAGSFYYPESKLYRAIDTTFISALGGGSAKILTLQLTVDSTARARQDQLAADLKEHPQVTVADRIEGTPTNPSAATSAIVTALQQHPDVAGIWSCCDILNQPIVEALHEVATSGGRRPVVVGPFPDQAMLKAIREGYLTAAVDLPWESYGWMAVDEAVQHFAHGTPLTSHAEPTQLPLALYAGQIITKSNVQQNPALLQPSVYDYAAYFTAKWRTEFSIAH